MQALHSLRGKGLVGYKEVDSLQPVNRSVLLCVSSVMFPDIKLSARMTSSAKKAGIAFYFHMCGSEI